MFLNPIILICYGLVLYCCLYAALQPATELFAVSGVVFLAVTLSLVGVILILVLTVTFLVFASLRAKYSGNRSTRNSIAGKLSIKSTLAQVDQCCNCYFTLLEVTYGEAIASSVKVTSTLANKL